MTVKIFTLYHFVPSAPLSNRLFEPLLTGVANPPPFVLSDARISVPPIDDCCEKAYYYIWQRLAQLGLRDTDHVGFQQYRRMFFFDVGSAVKDLHATSQSFFTVNADEFRQYRTDLQRADVIPIVDELEQYEVITTRPWPLDSVAAHFRSSHGGPATQAFSDALLHFGYDLYAEKLFHPACLLIMRVGLFREYMSDWWEFISLYDMPCVGDQGHTERIFGYALERFWSIWYRKHKAAMRCLEIPFVFCNSKGVDL